jgi:hypothetical protein
VSSIGNYAFQACSELESVSFPASVTSIGNYSFRNCSKLAKVYIYAPSLTKYGYDAFDNNAEGRKIYVPASALDTYKTEWDDYAADIEAMPYKVLKDDEAIDYNAIGSTADIWLSRTLKTGSWNTFASPVAIDADQLTALGITAVKQLGTSSFSEGVLTLNFTDAATIEAGKPYLVKISADKEIGAFDGATVSGTTTATETTAADFIPTLGATTITGDDANDILFLGSGNKLLHPESLPANMKGFRAYFLLKGEAALARSFRMDFGDGETSGIKAIDNGQLTIDNDRYYDLQGRRVNGAAQKGVYVVNGKKVIIK